MSDDLSKVDAVTLSADQAAMLRKVLTAIGGFGSVDHIHGHAYAPPQLVQEARDALALLSEPVDADLVEARRLAVGFRSGEKIRDEILTGERDSEEAIQALLAAIKHGRALERDSREG